MLLLEKAQKMKGICGQPLLSATLGINYHTNLHEDWGHGVNDSPIDGSHMEINLISNEFYWKEDVQTTPTIKRKIGQACPSVRLTIEDV